MKVYFDAKFNIGDKVRVKNPHSGNYSDRKSFEATVDGYVVFKTGRLVKVYYTLKGPAYHSAVASNGKKKRYLASELEKIEKER